MTDHDHHDRPELGAFKFTRAGYAAVSDRPFLLAGWRVGDGMQYFPLDATPDAMRAAAATILHNVRHIDALLAGADVQLDDATAAEYAEILEEGRGARAVLDVLYGSVKSQGALGVASSERGRGAAP